MTYTFLGFFQILLFLTQVFLLRPNVPVVDPEPLIKTTNELDQAKPVSINRTWKKYTKDSKVRTMVLFYCLAFGVGRAAFPLLFVFFMRPIDIGGMGKSVSFRNNHTWISLILSILILGLSSKLTKLPKSKKVFIITILCTQISSFTLMPFLDLYFK